MSLDKRLLAQVSHLYYERNLTQQQIANRTGLGRMKISRLLQKAKDTGVVRVLIDYTGTHVQLENRLAQQYGLAEVVIVDGNSEVGTKQRAAAAAAAYLEDIAQPGQTVAVGWGSTMSAVPEFIGDMTDKKLLFVPVIGGHGKSELDFHATSIASSLAKKTGCEAVSLLAPAFVSSVAERDSFIGDPNISETLAQAARANLAVFSLGNPVIPDSSISQSGYFSEADLKELREADTVCDLVSVLFLDREGKPCCTKITDRSVGLEAEQLKAIPRKICVVSGAQKRESTLVALRAGYIDVLIVDLSIADFLEQA